MLFYGCIQFILRFPYSFFLFGQLFLQSSKFFLRLILLFCNSDRVFSGRIRPGHGHHCFHICFQRFCGHVDLTRLLFHTQIQLRQCLIELIDNHFLTDLFRRRKLRFVLQIFQFGNQFLTTFRFRLQPRSGFFSASGCFPICFIQLLRLFHQIPRCSGCVVKHTDFIFMNNNIGANSCSKRRNRRHQQACRICTHGRVQQPLCHRRSFICCFICIPRHRYRFNSRCNHLHLNVRRSNPGNAGYNQVCMVQQPGKTINHYRKRILSHVDCFRCKFPHGKRQTVQRHAKLSIIHRILKPPDCSCCCIHCCFHVVVKDFISRDPQAFQCRIKNGYFAFQIIIQRFCHGSSSSVTVLQFSTKIIVFLSGSFEQGIDSSDIRFIEYTIEHLRFFCRRHIFQRNIQICCDIIQISHIPITV